MNDEHNHHDGLAQQRQALEQMSQELTLRLQEMIAQQEQRAHEFNALVPEQLPEMQVREEPQELVSPSFPQVESVIQLPPPPRPAASYQQPAPKAKPTPKPKAPRPRKLAKPAEPTEEGSIGPVAIGIIVFAIFIMLKSCS